MTKNIGDMTNNELKDFIIELQEENSRFERKISKLETSEKARKEAIEFINEYEKERNRFKWNEQDYIDVIDKIKEIIEKSDK